MEYTYIDIDAHIREANRARSQAMGRILAAGWNKLANLVRGLLHHPARGHQVAAR